MSIIVYDIIGKIAFDSIDIEIEKWHFIKFMKFYSQNLKMAFDYE